MNKNYSAFIVKNPVSLHHVVKLLPGQELVLIIDPDRYPNHSINVNSEYFYYKQSSSDSCVVYTFNFLAEINDWSRYSSCFLGEIYINCAKDSCKLLVILETSNPNKLNNLTIINPATCDIKVKPYNILEFVIFNTETGYRNWDWDWRPGLLNADLKLLHSSSSFSAMYDSSDFAYPRCSRLLLNDRTIFTGTRQSYFWFHFDKTLLECIDCNETNFFSAGLKHIGDLRFSVESYVKDSSLFPETFECSIWIDFKKKDIKRWLKSLDSLPTQTAQTAQLPPINQTVYSKKPVSYNRHLVHDVSITQIDFEEIDDDCLIVTDKNDINAISEYEHSFTSDDYTISAMNMHRHMTPWGYPIKNWSGHRTRWD